MFEKRQKLVELIMSRAGDKKALLSQRDIYGNSAVHLAVIQNSPELLAALLQRGAPRDASNHVRHL